MYFSKLGQDSERVNDNTNEKNREDWRRDASTSLTREILVQRALVVVEHLADHGKDGCVFLANAVAIEVLLVSQERFESPQIADADLIDLKRDISDRLLQQITV